MRALQDGARVAAEKVRRGGGRRSSGTGRVFHSHRNLGVTQLDSVFICGLPYAPPPTQRLPSRFTLRTSRALASELISARSYLQGARPQRGGGHGRRLAPGRWSGLWQRPLLNISSQSLIVASSSVSRLLSDQAASGRAPAGALQRCWRTSEDTDARLLPLTGGRRSSLFNGRGLIGGLRWDGGRSVIPDCPPPPLWFLPP